MFEFLIVIYLVFISLPNLPVTQCEKLVRYCVVWRYMLIRKVVVNVGVHVFLADAAISLHPI